MKAEELMKVYEAVQIELGNRYGKILKLQEAIDAISREEAPALYDELYLYIGKLLEAVKPYEDRVAELEKEISGKLYGKRGDQP